MPLADSVPLHPSDLRSIRNPSGAGVSPAAASLGQANRLSNATGGTPVPLCENSPG